MKGGWPRCPMAPPEAFSTRTEPRAAGNSLASLMICAEIQGVALMAMTKCTFFFGGGKAEGNKDMKELLGGKGAGLAEMSNIGIPVPPGITITTEVCTAFYRSGGKLPREVGGAIQAALRKIEALTGKRSGDAENPLLVSVRSGARVSMPGM